MNAQFTFCAWLFFPLWLWILVSTKKKATAKGESVGSQIVTSGIAALLMDFSIFCMIEAFLVTWPHL